MHITLEQINQLSNPAYHVRYWFNQIHWLKHEIEIDTLGLKILTIFESSTSQEKLERLERRMVSLNIQLQIARWNYLAWTIRKRNDVKLSQK